MSKVHKEEAKVIKFPKVAKKEIKSRACYLSGEGEEQTRLHDRLYRDLAYVTRADKPSAYIPLKTQVLLANLANMILRNEEGEEFVDHNFLSEITRCCSNRQNVNILNQLADIIDYKYYNCVTFQEKRRVYGYVIKFTADGEQRIKNPELFYDFVAKKLDNNFVSGVHKNTSQEENDFAPERNTFRPEKKTISLPYISNKDNTKENTKEIDIYVDRDASIFENEEIENYGEQTNDYFEILSDQFFNEVRAENNFNETGDEQESKNDSDSDSRWSLSRLKDFYPLTEEDAYILEKSSGREFGLNYINKLLLKLDNEKPSNSFRSKEAVLKYMACSLKGELRQTTSVNNEDFRFKQNEDAADKEAYLTKVEESIDTSKISQVRRKIAASYDSELAYEILTNTRYKEYANGSKYQVRTIRPISLSVHQEEILLNQVRSVFGNEVKQLEFITESEYKEQKQQQERSSYSLASQANSSTQSYQAPVLSVDLSTDTTWGKIRGYLRKHYGNALDISWFSKLTPEEDHANRKLTLKAPTSFICSYVQQHYQHTIEKYCESVNYQLTGIC